MGKKKTETTQQNTYQYMQAPENPYYTQAREALNNIDFRTPIIQNYGRLDKQIQESGNDIYGANTSPELADKVRAGRRFNATLAKGRDLSNAVQQENAAKISGNMPLGAATAPQLVQTGGTSTMTQPFNWGGLISSGIQGGSSIASAAIGA